MIRRAVSSAALAAAVVLAAVPASAGGLVAAVVEPTVAAPAPAERGAAPDWRFTVMPYVWASGVTGRLRPFEGGPTVDVDKSFGDVLKNLDSAFFLSFGAERGRFVVLGDVSRVASSSAGTVSVPGSGTAPAEGSLTTTTLTLAAGYRAVAAPRAAVDVFGGLRTYRIEADVQVAGGLLAASPTRSITDPILGARATFALAPRWSAMLYGDVGGFGVGTKRSAVASVLVSYSFNDRFIVSAGYRSMWIDYNEGGTLADAHVQGPLLGAAFRF